MRTLVDPQTKGQIWLDRSVGTELQWDTPCQRGALAGKVQNQVFVLLPLPRDFMLLFLLLSSTEGLLLGCAAVSWAMAGSWDAAGVAAGTALFLLWVPDMLGTIFLSSWCPVTESTSEKGQSTLKMQIFGISFFIFHGHINCCIKKCWSHIYKVEPYIIAW